MRTATTSLTGRRLLVVEDEFYLAEDLAKDLTARGATVIGPVPSVNDALDLIEDTEHIDGAVLYLNLQGEQAYPVADALIERGVPFVFTTGYDASAIPSRYASVPRCEKPVDPKRVAQALFG